jgi:hypothetical protein
MSRLKGEKGSAVKSKMPLASRLPDGTCRGSGKQTVESSPLMLLTLYWNARRSNTWSGVVDKLPWRWNDGRWGRFQEEEDGGKGSLSRLPGRPKRLAITKKYDSFGSKPRGYQNWTDGTLFVRCGWRDGWGEDGKAYTINSNNAGFYNLGDMNRTA